MWASITIFELKYQLKSPTFWISFVIFLLMSFGFVASPAGQVSGNVLKNSPTIIIVITAVMSMFYMFVVTAFAGNVILRDQETRFGPLIHATHLSKSGYVYGRVLGAFLICALCFLAVPIGMLVGSLMPWIDKDTIGPVRLDAYAYAYGLIALPSIFFMVAFFSSMATLTRSMMGSYLCAAALFIGYMAASFAADKAEWIQSFYAWVEPFGDAAIGHVIRYWTAVESNTQLPPFVGIILGNRLLYIAIGVGFVVLTKTLLRYDPVSVKSRKKADTAPARGVVETLPDPRFGAGSVFNTFVMRTRFEVGQVITSPAFSILMIMGLVFTGIMVMAANQLFGTDIYPVTRVMVSTISSGFAFFAIIVAIFYAGELVWRERDRRTHEIIDATAIPNWAYLVPKALALALVLFSTLCISIVADMAVQIFKGYTHFEFGKYVVWFLLPRTLDFFLTAVLAIFLQALSPNKFIGWGLMVVYLVIKIVMARFGFDHLLYNYNAAPPILLSDMNGQGQFWIGWVWLKLYWSAFAIILLVISHLLWRRGVAASVLSRLALIPQRLKSGAGVILALAVVAFAGLGGFIFYNTNILHDYLTKKELEKREAAYEKTFTPISRLPQPQIADVKLTVDLYPHQLRYTSRGSYVLKNETQAAIPDIYVESPHRLIYSAMDIDGARLAKTYELNDVRVYHLTTPMAPGETRTMHFNATFAEKGFSNTGIVASLVDNGTFLHNREVTPSIGILDPQAMTDKSTRTKYGLPPLQRMKKLEDASANADNYIHASWTTSDITISTVADQTPMAPGDKVSDVTGGGRRTARFVSSVPILNFFSVQSARYKEKHLLHNGVDLAVYYDAQHAYNVDRMLKTLATSLDYYQANFGPYQFKQARILEFPAYNTYAQSFAGTIPYSEGIGFIADVRDPAKVDYVTYVTAHELGHQWWAHQIVGANKQGATALSETLAQYSALMVMEKIYGPDQIRKFLKSELNTYLRSRGTEQIEEMPLYRVENQQYIHYNKGSLVMYLLKDRLGEDKVNAALRRLLAQYRFKGAPYPSSTDLVAALRAEAAPEDQALITDLFEKITLVDLRARNAVVKKRADGNYDVAFDVEAHKFYAGGKGKETETPLNDMIDIGLFTEKPGEKAFTSKNVLQMGRQKIHNGVQHLTFVMDHAPTYVGVDPYNKWIDRDSDDNVAKVGDTSK